MEQLGTESFGSAGGKGAKPGSADHAAEEWGPLDADPLASDATEKKKHTGILVLILVVGLAIGSLFSMHTLTKVTASSGRDTDIERIVDGFIASMSGGSPNDPDGSTPGLATEHKEVVEILTDSFTEHQVKQLQKNPFDVGGGQIAFSGGAEDGDFARAQRRDLIERAAETLELKSVIGGKRPLANVNGKIVKEGQKIPIELSHMGGEISFLVVKITSESVTVVAEDPEIDLKVEKVIKLRR